MRAKAACSVMPGWQRSSAVRAAIILAALSLSATSCGRHNVASDSTVLGYDGLVERVANNQVGYAADQWIEMKNMSGEWEKTGLIFGYSDDYEECLKAVAGLKKVNFAREHRCVLAQDKPR